MSAVVAISPASSSSFGDLQFYQHVGQAMIPTVKHGDWVGVLPATDFHSDALYVVSAGVFKGVEKLDLCRCQHLVGQRLIHVFHDHPDYRDGAVLSAGDFSSIVRGMVVMRCIIDHPAKLGL